MAKNLFLPNMKIKLLITIGLFYVLFQPLRAQDTLYSYFDAVWNETSKKESVFYRKYFENINKTWTVLDFFQNGKLQMSGYYADKELKYKTGEFFYYYENGKIHTHTIYRNDSTIDFDESYFESGKIEAISKTVNGKDTLRRYYENGKLEVMAEMKNRVQHGTSVYYGEKGNLSSKGKYFKGNKTGEWKYYDENGDYISSEYPVQSFDLPCKFTQNFIEDNWINVNREIHNVRKDNFSIDNFMRKNSFSKSEKEMYFSLDAGCYHNVPDERMTAEYLAESILKNNKNKGKKIDSWKGNPVDLNDGVLYFYTDKKNGKKRDNFLYVKREDDMAVELFFAYDPGMDEKFILDVFAIIKAVEYK